MTTKKTALRLAKRLDEVGFSDIVQIRNKVIELRTAGELVHAFHGGEPFFETPEPIKYAMVRALVENKTKYVKRCTEHVIEPKCSSCGSASAASLTPSVTLAN